MPRPKRGEPEMLLVSFCDIVTITTCAMFMAMIIVIDESMKIPVVSPVPVLHSTTNAPVYFECRDGMVFPIDIGSLRKTFQERSADFQKQTGSTAVEKLLSLDAGDASYRFDPALALMGMMGLQPRPSAKGTLLTEMVEHTNNTFLASVLNLNTGTQYCVFFVRDNGFNVFRKCREIAVKAGFRHGWELLAHDEPITFEGMMSSPGYQ